jgi:endoglucanase
MKYYRIMLLLVLSSIGGCAEPIIHENFKFNQLGFRPNGEKIAVIPAGKAREFVLTTIDGAEVYKGQLSAPRDWPYSGEQVQLADFSAFTGSGRFQLRAGKLPPSEPFSIEAGIYKNLNVSALKAFYYNRTVEDLKPEHAGQWARPGGHPDDKIIVHASAASEGRPAGTIIASPGGWYDAGDYNKYIVNSGITTYTLLLAYEQFPAYYQTLNVNIPESGNAVADILDEALFNIRWMLTMQDPADGGVYHKVTTQDFDGFVMPHEVTFNRYVVQKNTGATLNFAAVMAVCHRIFAAIDAPLAADCLRAGIGAWNWALKNPQVLYKQPEDIQTGAYIVGHEDFKDEFAWAGTELFIATGDARYIDGIDFATLPAGIPSWDWVSPLAWISLSQHADAVKTKVPVELIRTKIFETADLLKNEYTQSAYRLAMGTFAEGFTIGKQLKDFVWGSSSVAANQGIMLIQAYRLAGDRSYLEAAAANLDYILGRNPLGLSFVTGWGNKYPMHIHHRPSEADGIEEPVPGFLVGGPHSGQQDAEYCKNSAKAEYSSQLPAISFLDHVCSFASNEIAINWNAPLVYLTGAVENL